MAQLTASPPTPMYRAALVVTWRRISITYFNSHPFSPQRIENIIMVAEKLRLDNPDITTVANLASADKESRSRSTSQSLTVGEKKGNLGANIGV